MIDRQIKRNKGNFQQLCKIGILSLGCPRNLVDSESILGGLNLKGHPVVDMLKADVAIVNTCAFIEDAKRESIDAILDLIDLKKRGKLKKIIVYGCLAQRYKEGLVKEFPEIDAFVGKVSLNHDLKAFSITPSPYSVTFQDLDLATPSPLPYLQEPPVQRALWP